MLFKDLEEELKIHPIYFKSDAFGLIKAIDNFDITQEVQFSDSNTPQTYWRVMKKRLKDEGNETVTNCNGLKLKAQDGKYRMTDVCDIEGMFRIL